MPFCEANDIRLYYEVTGNGPNLLLVSGIGGGTWSWFGQIPFFKRHYRIITVDNRGVGQSSMPPGPYRMEQFAADLLGVLDHLEVSETFVLGLSMGGMIGQYLGIHHADRLRSLSLCDTSALMAEEAQPLWQERIEIARSRESDAEHQRILRGVLNLVEACRVETGLQADARRIRRSRERRRLTRREGPVGARDFHHA